MKVAHLVIVTPGRCGLYETTRELVSGLRKLGVDSRMVEPGHNKLFPDGYPHNEDRGCPVADMKWAVEADVLVNHSGYDGTVLAKTNQPIVHVAHGRPRSGFIGERDGGTPVYSYHYRQNADSRWKSIVTFWPEHVKYHEIMFPDKRIDCVTAPVDLDTWTPGEDKYSFNGKRGQINVVCTDAWRDDVDPFLPLNVFASWARKHPGAKLHLYAKPDNLRGYSALIRRIQDDGNMGEMLGWIKKGLDQVYRSADALLTANNIATRAHREAMACGCPVAIVDSSLPEWSLNAALGADRKMVRLQAERRFDPERTAQEFKAVLDR